MHKSDHAMIKKYKNPILGFFSTLILSSASVYAGYDGLDTPHTLININAMVLPECEFDIPEVIIFENVSSTDVKNKNPEDRVSGMKVFEVSASCPGANKINLEIIPKFSAGKCIATTRDNQEGVTEDILRFCLEADGEMVDFSENNVIYAFEQSSFKKEFAVSINLGADNNLNNIVGTYQGYIDIRFTPD